MRRVVPVFIALLLVATACGDDGASTTTVTLPSTTIGDDTTTVPTVPSGAVTQLEEVRSAVVQIVARGSFMDPFQGAQVNIPGAGSGFIIDPSGLAVTNNHVVTGAAILDVWVPGHDRPLNATVVAVSECSDLAVIQIVGDGFPYLQWYDGPVTAGMTVYAAGFPLGDPEYTLLNGIVSKERVDGETSWASVDAVIEHTAATLPGNSGGPLVTADGRVVAVNFAGNQVGQHFAIGLDVARPMVERLTTGGVDIESIGINGEALSVAGFNGIWVYSVKSGSPADLAGIQGGDLVVSLENLTLADDGTMADYCDVLRSRRSTDVLAVDVYRPGTDELLRGQVNGRTLEVITSFAVDFGDPVAHGDAYTDYVWITDDDDIIEVRVPVEWTDVSGGSWSRSGQVVGSQVQASTNLGEWHSGWSTPGVFVGASATLGLTPKQMLDENRFDTSCNTVSRHDYDDGVYRGIFDLYDQCGGVGTRFLTIAAQEPGDWSFLVYVQLVIVTDADLAAADEVINSFMVIGDL
jgi:serine protease Do